MNVISVDFKAIRKLTPKTRVNLRGVWEKLNKPKQFGDWVKQVTERLNENSDFGFIHLEVKKSRGRPKVEYWVTVECAKMIGMLTNNEAGDEVRRYFLECEELVQDSNLDQYLTSIPDLLNPDILIALGNKIKETEAQRDKAVKEKAWIEHRARASAMGTASAERKRARKAEKKAEWAELDALYSHNQVLELRAEIKRLKSTVPSDKTFRSASYIAKTNPIKAFNVSAQFLGQALPRISKELGLEVRKVPHPTHPWYTPTSEYHVDAVIELARRLQKATRP